MGETPELQGLSQEDENQGFDQFGIHRNLHFKIHKREDSIGFVLGGPAVGKCERPECVKVSWDERSMERIALLILDNYRIGMVLGTLADLGLL